MNKENTEHLNKEYNMFFAQPYEGPQMPFELFGWEIGDGWFTIIDEFLHWLKFNVEHNDYPRIIITQVKEKFGTLRFYYTINMDVAQKIEQPSRYKHSKDVTKERSEHFARCANEIEGAVSFLEDLSSRYCEECGTDKEVTTEGRWILTLCKTCRIKRNEKN